eukprot:scaffold12817_cov75-Phaeocystis_antarctica.AAC.10
MHWEHPRRQHDFSMTSASAVARLGRLLGGRRRRGRMARAGGDPADTGGARGGSRRGRRGG